MPPEVWNSVKRILAVRMDNIGDLVMLGPALREIKRFLPQSTIDLLASPAGSQVASLLPWIDQVISWRALWQDISGVVPFDPDRELDLVNQLRAREYDAALIFTSFSQSPFPPAYVCYLAGIPVRIGHSKEFGGKVLSEAFQPPPDGGHQVERNLGLLEKAGIPIHNRKIELHVPPEDRARAFHLLRESGLVADDPYIILAPGASAASRRYPPDRFAAAAEQLAGQTGMPLLVVGTMREAKNFAPVLDAADGRSIFSLVGRTSLPELAALIQGARLVIANNSASLHLADAFQIPVVVFYSGTELESQWAPRRAPFRLLRRDTVCTPCYRFDCPYHQECLDVSVGEAVQAALELLESTDPAEGDPNAIEGAAAGEKKQKITGSILSGATGAADDFEPREANEEIDRRMMSRTDAYE